MDTAIADRSVLENLVSDPDFEWLEARLAPFNLFEALGVTSQEVRHSDFLAFLLAPSNNHGLGSTFLKRFLQATVRRGQGAAPISLVDLDLADLTECDIRREWQSIDVLMLLPALRLAAIIENKILERRTRSTVRAVLGHSRTTLARVAYSGASSGAAERRS